MAPSALNVCNDKGCSGVVEGLLMLAAGISIVTVIVSVGSIVAGTDLQLREGSNVNVKTKSPYSYTYGQASKL